MSNFKSGSGNLDFGSDNDGKSADESVEDQSQPETESEPAPSGKKTTAPSEKPSSGAVESPDNESPNESSTPDYPYFVRRNNVGDERDKRLEIHLRDKVAAQEAAFRNELATELETDEVAKTDAREFALLAAFQHPEQVAELMKSEGYGALD
ncbi:acyl-CoA dehydrogenase [Haloarcula nitratireducens]|uniref:Acyl-CoA dehydrogenase n=1 Tax=Haloarcula nitratireducens TaxID=2487749 RepID=A0AAW4PHY2_9EURY|nr:acyl-CoA dehydrogenase [Halomicroarcula nitratireducens]MBX0297707.1 acyl-CoA dehydrogenase [Halomicroarcula nitratireducens]